MNRRFLNILLIFILLVSSLYIYIPKTHAADSWSTGAAGGTAREDFGAVQYDGKIYFWGGWNGGMLNSLNIYDISTNAWSSGASGGTTRYYPNMEVYNGKIYIWGGCGNGNCSYYPKMVDIYDISLNSWSTGASGGTTRIRSASAIYDNKIYFWGGNNDANVLLNSIDIYNIELNSWSSGTSGGTARNYLKAESYNGKIYFWGGIDSLNYSNTMDIYDITSNSWSTGLSGGTGRYVYSSTIYGDNIYYHGGYRGGVLNTIDIYNITSNTWSTGTAGGTARRRHEISQRDGIIYSWSGQNSAGTRINTLDIYDTGYHPNPEFQILPGDTRTINLDEGQVITTPTYTIEVYPTSPNEIEKVEFYVDNALIETDTTADLDGVYSYLWDTTLYHSDIKVIAYDPFGRTTELTRTVTVPQATPSPSNVTELPATGMDR